MNPADFIQNNFNLSLSDLSTNSNYIKVGIIVALLFLLVMSMAQVRRHFLKWGLKGGVVGIFIGFLLALVLEGFLLVGGKTALTEFLGWKNPPKVLEVALDQGRDQLVQVLGVTDQIPQSSAKSTPTLNDAIDIMQNLNPSDSKAIRSLICQP
ncbi:hypothetical protein ACFL1Q_02040 [Patescibacteria group bacterium]